MEIKEDFLKERTKKRKEFKKYLGEALQKRKAIRKCKGIKIICEGHAYGCGLYAWYQCKHLDSNLRCKIDKNNNLCDKNHKWFLFFPYCPYKRYIKIRDPIYGRYEKYCKDSIYGRYEKYCKDRDKYKKLLRDI
ncbi:MAG: hypothetical protein JRI72_00190 [Deltaproteobacteria bacterium]|nr:hypothetical protein [Deltaproteobacteria bacterium]